MRLLAGVSEAMERGIAAGIPGAQLCVVHDGECLHQSAHGTASLNTRFDLASLTKLLATTTVAASLVGRGQLDLDAPVQRYLPAFQGEGKEAVTVRDLLCHRSGLPAWKPYFADYFRGDALPVLLADPSAHAEARALHLAAIRPRVVERVLGEALEHPRGTRVYSDVGFIVLGELLEVVGGAPLPQLCVGEVFGRIGLGSLGFRSLLEPLLPGPFLATGRTRPREPAPGQEALFAVPDQAPAERLGEVDDDNAWILGGVAGHAGLFGTAVAVARLGDALIANVHGDGTWLPAGLLADWVRPDPDATGPERGIGFDRVAGEGSTAGSLLGTSGPLGGAGHLGFTGCSLWLDLDQRLSVALLTNRTLAGREQVKAIRELRPTVHDAVLEAVFQVVRSRS